MPTVYNVTSGLDSGTGSLRAAYADAISNGNQAEIVIADGVDAIELDSPLISGSIGLTVLTITHAGDERCVITPSTTGSYRFINHSGNNGITITLENLSLEEFGTSGDGGAVKTVAPLVLNDCGFDSNHADGDGGAIYAEYSLTAEDCDFLFNEAEGNGGAIFIEPQNTAAASSLTDCTFTTNSATSGDGGAIYFHGVENILYISGNATLFTMNSASNGSGGAIYQYGGGISLITTGGSGMLFDNDSGDASELYLTELLGAHIDIDIEEMADPAIYLHSSIPPSTTGYWSYINVSRIVGGTGAIDSNWPYQ